MKKFKFLKDGALVISGKNENMLIIGDIHLGIESEFARMGISIPSQTKNIQKKIDRIVRENKINHIIFLGDLKHKIPVISHQEEKEVPKFLAHFLKLTKISVIKGNHDGKLEDIVPKSVDVYDSSGFIVDNIYFCHGKNKPIEGKYKTIVMSHIHPVIEFLSSGIRMTEPVWVITKMKNGKKVIILPSFTHLKGGASINSVEFTANCPILKNSDFENSEIFLLDGTYLGKLKNIKLKKRQRKK